MEHPAIVIDATKFHLFDLSTRIIHPDKANRSFFSNFLQSSTVYRGMRIDCFNLEIELSSLERR